MQDVFGEGDPACRRVAIDEIFTEDCTFCDLTRGIYPCRRFMTATKSTLWKIAAET